MEKTVPLRLIIVDSDTQELNLLSYNLTFNLVSIVDAHKDFDEVQLEQSISFTKIMSFLEYVVDNSILFDSDSAVQNNKIFSGFMNNLIVLPDISEHTFLAALHSKLNAIIKDSSQVDKLRLAEDSQGVLYEYILIDEYYDELPTSEEWTTDMSYWSGCWWTRADANTLDLEAETPEELERWKKSSKTVDNLFTKMFDDIDEAYYGAKQHDGELIPVDFEKKQPIKRWTPTLVD